MALPEIHGLSPNAASGTRLDVYVTWRPPVTRRPQVQLLLRRVTLETIVPPLTADGPATALLSVKNDEVGDLLYADRFGTLAATTLP